jgi:hypothetical protein
MPMEKWDKCAVPISEDDLEGRVCYGGWTCPRQRISPRLCWCSRRLDDDDKYAVLPYFWIPVDNIGLRVRRDHVPYEHGRSKAYC